MIDEKDIENLNKETTEIVENENVEEVAEEVNTETPAEETPADDGLVVKSASRGRRGGRKAKGNSSKKDK